MILEHSFEFNEIFEPEAGIGDRLRHHQKPWRKSVPGLPEQGKIRPWHLEPFISILVAAIMWMCDCWCGDDSIERRKGLSWILPDSEGRPPANVVNAIL